MSKPNLRWDTRKYTTIGWSGNLRIVTIIDPELDEGFVWSLPNIRLGKASRYQLAGTRKTLKAAKSAALKAWRRWVAEAGLEARS